MDKLFNPDGIAVVGASANPAKAGFVAIRNMREKEYPGKVFPINPNEKGYLRLSLPWVTQGYQRECGPGGSDHALPADL